MGLLADVDFKQTRDNARKVLSSYRRLQRITGRSKVDIKSPLITDMPKAQSHGNKAEDAIVQKVYAESERNAILDALDLLGLTSKEILRYSYCMQDRWSNAGIADELGYSVRSIHRMRNEALIEFSEAYKHGELITYY